MRNISFSATKPQFRARQKHVTRRVVHKNTRSLWKSLKVGEHLMGIEKGQGLKKGEKIVRLGEIVVLEVNTEPLKEIITRPYRELPQRILEQYRIPNGFGGIVPDRICETRLEGFGHRYPNNFVEMFCKLDKCEPNQEVVRILFDYVDPVVPR